MIPLKDDNPTSGRPTVTYFLIGLCVVVFLMQLGSQSYKTGQLFYSYGLIPSVLMGHNQLPMDLYAIPGWLTIFTSMFMHGGFMHLIGNMLFLWIYGNNIEDAMGHIKFLLFYIICGISAAILQALVTPNSNIPMIGASGAVSGILSAYFLLYPKARVSTLIFVLFFITVIRIPAGILILIWFATQLINTNLTDPNSPGVAWFAHIGGFLMGILLLPFLKKKNKKYFASGNKHSLIQKNIRLRFRK